MILNCPENILESSWVIPGLALAYVLGSVPSSVWIGKTFYGVDVRTQGSHNPGATNTFRVLGKRAGIIVLVLDVSKGYLAAFIPVVLGQLNKIPIDYQNEWPMVFGLSAVVGHLFPVFTRFIGGKGVATLLGMVLAIHPLAALASLGIFIMILLLSGYVSLGSIVATLSFPILQIMVPELKPASDMYIYFGIAVFLLVVLTHRQNIKRLIQGTENKTSLLSSRSEQSK